MLQFKDIAQQESTLKTIGTVAEFVGVKGSYEPLSEKNFKGVVNPKTDKLNRVTIALYNEQGQRAIINCSEPLSANLRSSKSKEELQTKLANLALLPILELPQVERDETSPNFGKAVLVADEETGEMKPLIIYTISNVGGKDMSNISVKITEDILNKKLTSVAINLEDLIAM
jgi:predicted transcriptional regulator